MPFKSLLLLVWRYFKRKGNSEKLPFASSNSEVCSAIESNNSKKRGQYGKYTPEQKAMVGKTAAEHGVVVNLCIPDRFILLVTSYYYFHFETRGHSSTRARGVWFRPDPTTTFLTRITKNPIIHEKYPLYCIEDILSTF